MKQTFGVLALTLLLLVVLDGLVAAGLAGARSLGRLNGLVQYFEYGRSVPGKLARWQETPGARGNLFDVAWRPDILAQSQAAFSAEPEDIGPVLRNYGMSFSHHIVQAAVAEDPGLRDDEHGGPAAPPNFTFALFEEDRANRRRGDIVVLGILSSSVPALAALSNRTWVFEQPAPFTYPVYRPEGAGDLRRIEPLVNSAGAERGLAGDPALAGAWRDQLRAQDAFYGPLTFGLPALDASPFLRLVRRSLAISHVDKTKAAVLGGGYPHAEVLRRMVRLFAETAREDGQLPVVLLIQSRQATDMDLAAELVPELQAGQIPYLATADEVDPRDPAAFLPDGHYTPEANRRFGKALLDLIARERAS